MKVDTQLPTTGLDQIVHAAREAEEAGFDGLYTVETQHDPLLPHALAAEHTSRIQLGTAITVAFPRSPAHLAQTSNDLHAFSGGRFMLGLGSQVKAHVEKRFGAAFDPPVSRMREFIQALRAFWRCWNEGERLNFRGQYFRHTLMTPFFAPPPNPYGAPPVLLAAVGPRMTALAGEVADGLLLHSFTTRRYLEQTVLPALERGARRAGRSRADLEVVAPAFVVTGADEREYAEAIARTRQAIAFYGSTPSYRGVLETHGWGDLQDELNALSKRGRWDEMARLIDDEMLDSFAVRGEPKQVADALRQRYGDLCTRVAFSMHSTRDPRIGAEIMERLRSLGDTPSRDVSRD